MFAESDLIPISALQQFLYCPRRCALIHIEKVWEDSRDTVLGQMVHQKAHAQTTEKRKYLKTVTALPIRSLHYGLVGVADVVEFRSGIAYPIEYKKGRSRISTADRVQLCAQAICLAEMTCQTVKEGAIFYHTTRRRVTVEFDEQLHSLTIETAVSVRHLVEKAILPKAHYSPQLCTKCSLINRCQPNVVRDVGLWIHAMLDET